MQILPLILWGSYFIFQASAMMNRLPWQWAMARASVVVLMHAFLFYLHIKILFPRFFEARNYIVYGLLLAASFFVAANIVSHIDEWLFREHLYEFQPPPWLEEIPEEVRKRHLLRRPRGPGFRFFNLVFWVESILVFFLSLLYYYSKKSAEREQETIELRNKVLEAESRFLKSQINPHFLFNALNNIYSLSLMRSALAPEAIFKLSSILRYVLYESKGEFVELEKELAYVDDYIDLQKLKDEDAENIKYSTQIDGSGMKIAPMLLIPFIENAFKHSNVDDKVNGWVKISIKTAEEGLIFTCSNSFSPNQGTKDAQGGVGLQNVKRRLDLIYKDAYELSITDDAEVYTCVLRLRQLSGN